MCFFCPTKKHMQEQKTCKKCMDFFARHKNPCKISVWIYTPLAKSCKKCMVFFARHKNPCKSKKHAKSAWIFSPDVKTNAKVYGFIRP
jgi:hypothetical protein